MKSRRPLLLRLNKQVALLALAIGIAGCQKNTLYHTYQSVEPTGWNKHDTVVFSLPHPIKVSDCKGWQIGIRHLDSYPYQDIWLDVAGDTLHLRLTDQTGNWRGNGLGSLLQFNESIPIPRQYKDSDSIRRIPITHLMKHNPLPAISDIGIHISQEP